MVNAIFGDKEIAEMKKMYQEGHGLMYIATHFYSNNTTIKNILVDNGVVLRNRGGFEIVAPENVIKKSIDMYKNGKSINEISKFFGYSNTTIRRWLLENGVKLKPRGYDNPNRGKETKNVAEIVEGQPIDCNTQGKRCIYRNPDDKNGYCNYCLTVGRCRGGSPHECTKYKFPEKKKRVK